jgi:hypothetical protein
MVKIKPRNITFLCLVFIDGKDKTKEYYFPVFGFNCCSGFNDKTFLHNLASYF